MTAFIAVLQPALSAHRRVCRFPSAVRGRQSGHFLETASLHPPPAALRRFPQSRRASCCGNTKKSSALALCLDFFDRGHSLGSLFPPPAAVASLPNCATPGYFVSGIHYTTFPRSLQEHKTGEGTEALPYLCFLLSYRPRAAFRASTRSVISHFTPRSSRPIWP